MRLRLWFISQISPLHPFMMRSLNTTLWSSFFFLNYVRPMTRFSTGSTFSLSQYYLFKLNLVLRTPMATPCGTWATWRKWWWGTSRARLTSTSASITSTRTPWTPGIKQMVKEIAQIVKECSKTRKFSLMGGRGYPPFPLRKIYWKLSQKLCFAGKKRCFSKKNSKLLSGRGGGCPSFPLTFFY